MCYYLLASKAVMDKEASTLLSYYPNLLLMELHLAFLQIICPNMWLYLLKTY